MLSSYHKRSSSWQERRGAPVTTGDKQIPIEAYSFYRYWFIQFDANCNIIKENYKCKVCHQDFFFFFYECKIITIQMYFVICLDHTRLMAKAEQSVCSIMKCFQLAVLKTNKHYVDSCSIKSCLSGLESVPSSYQLIH